MVDRLKGINQCEPKEEQYNVSGGWNVSSFTSKLGIINLELRLNTMNRLK